MRITLLILILIFVTSCGQKNSSSTSSFDTSSSGTNTGLKSNFVVDIINTVEGMQFTNSQLKEMFWHYKFDYYSDDHIVFQDDEGVKKLHLAFGYPYSFINQLDKKCERFICPFDIANSENTEMLPSMSYYNSPYGEKISCSITSNGFKCRDNKSGDFISLEDKTPHGLTTYWIKKHQQTDFTGTMFINDERVAYSSSVSIKPAIKNKKQLMIQTSFYKNDDMELKPYHCTLNSDVNENKDVTCEVNNFELQVDFDNPAAIAIGVNTICGIDGGVVKCFQLDHGKISKDWTFSDLIKRPKELIVVTNNDRKVVCAISDNELACSEIGGFGRSDRQSLNINIRGISKFISPNDQDQYFYLIGDKEIYPYYLPFMFSDHEELKIIQAQQNFDIYSRSKSPFQFSYLNAVSIKKDQYSSNTEGCAIDGAELKCWQNKTVLKVPKLEHPREVTIGNEQITYKNPSLPAYIVTKICAIDDIGVNCWVYDAFNDGFIMVRTPVSVKFNSALQILDTFVYPLIRYLPISRTNTIGHLGTLININKSQFDLNSLYLTFELVKKQISSVDSKFFRDDILPALKDKTEYVQAKINKSDINQIEGSELNRKITINFIQSSIETASNFLSAEDKESLQNLIRKLGNATIDPMDNQAIKDLIVEINNQKNILNKLNGSSKSKFLVETIDLAKNWLGEKIK